MSNVRFGVVGNGGRGTDHVKMLAAMPDVDLVAVCDVYEDRVEKAKQLAEEIQAGIKVTAYLEYKEMFAKAGLDGVVIASSWDTHARIGAAALRAGIYAGLECGGANSIEECWNLVRAHEETGAHCMYLENCCYSRQSLSLLTMIRSGLFGELIHCAGGYQHDLRNEVAYGRENRHYRLDNFHYRCAEFYPAHVLGPIQTFLRINHGNRFLTLVSMASKARGLHEYIVREKGAECEEASMSVAEGDVVSTLIKCADGATVYLTHDDTLPRPKSFGTRVQGTRGIYMEDGGGIHIEGLTQPKRYDVFSDYVAKYQHPLWREYDAEAQKPAGSHGGMDYMVERAFIEAVQKRIAPPLDTFDAATLLSVTALSEQSIMLGSSAVAVPDFTDGRWMHREAAPISKYALR